MIFFFNENWINAEICHTKILYNSLHALTLALAFNSLHLRFEQKKLYLLLDAFAHKNSISNGMCIRTSWCRSLTWISIILWFDCYTHSKLWSRHTENQRNFLWLVLFFLLLFIVSLFNLAHYMYIIHSWNV